MSRTHNFTLSEFENKIRDAFRDDFDSDEYQQRAGFVAEDARDHFFKDKGDYRGRASNFPEWLKPIGEHRGGYDETEFERNRKRFKYTAIDSMKRDKSNALHFAVMLHYRLHWGQDDKSIELAARLDKLIFDQKTFETTHTKPVFVYDPDYYTEPPPMAAPMTHPEYITAKSAREALEDNSEDSIWLNPHNHFTLPLEDREAEKTRLTQFVRQEGMFRVLPVIAPSGAGKTRLISEWMRTYSQKTNPETTWEAGLLSSDQNNQARNPEPWKTWNIKKHTLIVIDYTYAFDEVVKAIAKSAINRADGRDLKVRLIVIDHVMPKVLQDDFLWQGMVNSKRGADYFRSSYLERELELKSAGDKSAMLRKIIAAAARVGVRDAPENDAMISEALKQLDRMGKEQGDRDSVRHPLFAALMGRALRNEGSKVDFSTWTRRDLVEQYFSGKDRLPWIPATTQPNDTDTKRMTSGLYAGAWVSAATLRRGLMRVDAEPHLPSDVDRVFQIAQRVISSANTFEIGPFLPDILGETFLLKFLEAASDHPEIFNAFVAMLNAPGKNQVDLARNFRESIARLARNLAADDPVLPEVQKAWADTAKILDPQLYYDEAPLRTQVSYSIADVKEILAGVIAKGSKADEMVGIEAAYGRLMDQLEAQAEPELIFAISDTESLISWIRTCFRFFEFVSEMLRRKLQYQLLDAARTFAKVHDKKWTATKLAAYDGRLYSLCLIARQLNEDVKEPIEDGVTAAMLASQNGHLDVLRFLHTETKCDLAAAREDGVTAAMLASQNGHLDVLRFLHTETKCDLAAAREDGVTAAMLASQNGHLDVLRFLSEQKVDVLTASNDGRTTLMAACVAGTLEIVVFLIGEGTDLEVTMSLAGIDGVNALMLASDGGLLSIVEFLVSKGANPLSETSDGRTAISFAQASGHQEVVEYLRSI